MTGNQKTLDPDPVDVDDLIVVQQHFFIVDHLLALGQLYQCQLPEDPDWLPIIVAGIIIIWVVRETASFFWESMGRKCLSNPEKCCMYRRKHCAAQKPTVE